MKKTILLGIVLISLLALMLPASQAHALGEPVILYAKPTATGNGDCMSWANACTLQTALAADYPSYQIWVMAGVYMPHPSDRTVSFELKNGAVVFGGFAGTETLLSQRDIMANKTTLSGDIGTAHDISDNYYHVVVAIGTNSTAILNGVSITGGNANGDGQDDRGRWSVHQRHRDHQYRHLERQFRELWRCNL